MPELPEVETVRRSLLTHLVGRRVTTVTVHDSRLRVPVATEVLTRALLGRAFVGIRRRAKYLLFDTDSESVLLVHLGMSGQLCLTRSDAPRRKHDHVVLALGEGLELRFNDPRRFGL